MREIKFRAWTHGWHGKGPTSKMIRSGNLADTSSALSVVDFYPIKEGDTLMQFTGLKDKNDKDIYEGDIVQISGHPFQGSINIDGIYEVGYNELMELCCGGWYLHRMRHWAEVIGNKFENPELLKGENEDE